jgi:spore maturation protein CgeB
MKILLVSDAADFALTDVYNGYMHALEQLKIPFEFFPYHTFRSFCSDNTCFHRIHSTALIKEKEFTHVMFIGGLNVPDYIFTNLYHIKSIVVSTEDPHSFGIMERKLDIIDYYFTNERSIYKLGKYKNVFYCPTAADNVECGKMPSMYLDEKYKSDILFLGAIYPNRKKILESIIPFVKKHNLNFKICGHTNFIPKNSPLREFVFDDRTIPHSETIKYYSGTKIVLNIFRDVNWSYLTKSGKNPFNKKKIEAESLNPRAYEVPLCQTLMLIENSRKEVEEIFNENEVGFFYDEKSLIEQLKNFLFKKSQKEINNMILKAYKKVATNHTYLNRMMYIKSVIDSLG